VLADLEDLEMFRALLEIRGVRGLVVDCDDCDEPHYFSWDLLAGNLRHLLDVGQTRMHEPAFNPDPASYVSWDYARGFADGVLGPTTSRTSPGSGSARACAALLHQPESAHETPAEAQRHRLRSVVHAHLAKETAGMSLDRVLGQVQLPANGTVALALAHAAEHLEFTLGQRRGGRCRGVTDRLETRVRRRILHARHSVRNGGAELLMADVLAEKSAAPAAIASATASRSAATVSTTTLASGKASTSRRVASTPPIPGIRTSISTSSGRLMG